MRLVAACVLGMALGLAMRLWSGRFMRGVPVWDRLAWPCTPVDSLLSCVAAACVGGIVIPSIVAAFGWTLEGLQVVVLACLLLFLSLTDLDDYLIPNSCVVCAASVRIMYLGWRVCQGRAGGDMVAYYLASACAVGAFLLVTVLASERVLGQVGLGGGDLKLYATCALYVGWELSLVLVTLSCALGLVTSLLLGRQGSSCSRPAHVFPLGPSISAACLLVLLTM